MRILSKSCCLFRAGKNTEGFAWGVNMYKHLSSLHGSAGFVSTLPSEINQFTRGQVRGHAALKSAENVFPEGSLIFLWCFVSEVCVCVSCRDLAFWKSEPWGQDFDIALNIAGIVEYEYGLPFNAFPKDPQEAQSLIYYSMSSLGRTGWGFMGGQCSGALLNLEVEMSWPGCQVELGMGNLYSQTKLGMLLRVPHAPSSSLLLVASVWISGKPENVLEGEMPSWHIHPAWEVATGAPQPSQAQLSLEAKIP